MRSPYVQLCTLMLAAAFLLVACFGPPPPPQSDALTLLGRTGALAPDSSASFLVHLRDPVSKKPQASARVRVTLGAPGQGEQIFSGWTNAYGLAEVRFRVPQAPGNPRQTLTVTAGPHRRTESVYVGPTYNVLVSTDKPVYQPGQTIHIRGLALNRLALKAAQALTMTVTVANPDGNKLLRRELATSQFGVVAVDFPLDSQAPSGHYLVSAEMGPVVSTHSVEVKPYNLPRFKLTFATDQPFYQPGQPVTGQVDAHYFFGKPVAGGSVHIRGYVNDVGRNQVFDLAGETDANGVYHYAFPAPQFLAATLDNGTADLELEIEVVDTTGHAEIVNERVPISEQEILIDAVPESGMLKEHVENIVYLNASYPDGAAAQVSMTVAIEGLMDPLTLETDAYGLARFAFTPQFASQQSVTLTVTAADAAGRSADQILALHGDDTAILLRPDKAEYHIGDTMHLNILVAQEARTVYLDMIKGGQTFALEALSVQEGVAQTAIGVDGALLGTLELNAYVVGSSGEILRDRRLVLVNPGAAEVTVQTDAARYRPGDTALLDITTRRGDAPMPGVLGISIVDESVFEVGAQSPGFARTYFLIERELLQPRYEIHGFEKLEPDMESPYDYHSDDVRTGQVAPYGALASYNAPRGRDLALFGLFAEELAAQALGENEPIPGFIEQGVVEGIARRWAYAGHIPTALFFLGIPFYHKGRRRRYLLLTLLLIVLASQLFTACAMAPAAPASTGESVVAQQGASPAAGAGSAARTEAPRLRQFFPETLYWLPEVKTDSQGHARIEVPIADSITTWRVSVLASDADGNLGSAEASLPVFQEFFVEPDLPRFLTVGDELDAPIAIYNYLDTRQTVTLQIAEADWFEFTRPLELTAPISEQMGTVTVELAANEVTALYVPIRVTAFGRHNFQVTAQGEEAGDAVVREVEILPFGRPQVNSQSGILNGPQTIHVDIPEQATLGTPRVTVKFYPGVVSQALDGLDALLQVPAGCFEQTSSTTYPNVLVLDYLQTIGHTNSELQLKAEILINLGYQRLLTFEVSGHPGGFSLYGQAPPIAPLTAYGLMEFSDMSRVHYVDPALIERTAHFLMGQQQPDGSWAPDYFAPAGSRLATTAYTTWALADAGYADSYAVQSAVAYIQSHFSVTTSPISVSPVSASPVLSGDSSPANSPLPQPTASIQSNGDQDPYVLALAANALLAAGADASDLLLALAIESQQTEAGDLYWVSNAQTYLGSSGAPLTIETAALAAYALLRSQAHPDVAAAALRYIASQRDDRGGFHTTQATIAALRALLLAAEQQAARSTEPGQVEAVWSDGRMRSLDLAPAAQSEVQVMHFDDLAPGRSELQLDLLSGQPVPYQVVTEYYLPWQLGEQTARSDEAMRIDVAYDRTELAINEVVNVTAQAELLSGGPAGTVIVDLGVPPGFDVVTDDLEQMVAMGLVARYELTGRQIILYLTDVSSAQRYIFEYRLRARYPIRATTPSSTAYDYYQPDQRTEQAPQQIVVAHATP